MDAAALAIVVVTTVLVHLAIPLPSDVAWLLSVNERLFDGQHLYADILETNPPRAVGRYALPIGLERLTGLAAENYVILETIGTGLLSLWLSARTLGRLTLPIAIAAAVILLLPIDSFAQREHFALFGLLPWLALAMRRYDGDRPRGWAIVAAGIGLAIALAIKPHFAIVIVMVALLGAWRSRSWRPIFAAEHWLAAILLALYGVLIAIAYPDFLSVVLPAASQIYVPLRMDTLALLLQPHALLVYLALLLAATLYRRTATTDAMPVVLVATLGCLIVYLVQGKGWAYHLLPGTSLAVLAIATLGFARRQITVPALIGLLAAIPGLLWLVTSLARPEPLLALQSYGRGLSIALISSDIGLANPVHRQLGDRLVNSEPMLWRATGAIVLARTARADERPALAAYEAADRDRLTADLTRFRPDLVLADTKGFDWLAWARLDPRIAAILDGYTGDAVIPTHGTEITVLRRK